MAFPLAAVRISPSAVLLMTVFSICVASNELSIAKPGAVSTLNICFPFPGPENIMAGLLPKNHAVAETN